MKMMKLTGYCICLFVIVSYPAFAQAQHDFKMIPLNNFEAFVTPGKNWSIASDASVDFTKLHDMKPIAGEGALVNTPDNTNRSHLYTSAEFGDLELELDFMMAKNSNSGVYLQGRYEIQLLDSWARLQASSSDAGGIYLRWTKDRGHFEGASPFMNVSRAPGLWQHLQIKFRAPRFNEKGEKIKHAQFEEVYLNGVLVQQGAQMTGPTGSGMYPDEKPTGPVVLQGDHGPVAYKNFRYRPLAEEKIILHRPQSYKELVNPIIVRTDTYPYVLRSFMYHEEKKINYAVSVGNPSQIHFSYDLKTGALFQAWRGDFLDATPMWNQRGEQQVAIPLGSVLSFSDAPALAVLASEQAEWPESFAEDDLRIKGYSLDKQRSPVFKYRIQDMEVRDSIAAMVNREGIARTITVTNAPAHLYARIVAAKQVESLGADVYAINGKSYYLKISKALNPVIRKITGGEEIIVRYDANVPITYSIIW